MWKSIFSLALAISCFGNVICTPVGGLAEQYGREPREDSWCDPVLGCLYLTPEWWSLNRPINVLPDSRKKINTRFYLHTRTEPNDGINYIVSADNLTSLAHSPFDPNKPTKFISHGFVDTGNTQWLTDLALALLKYEDCNVLRVDWGDGSMPMYYQATANTRVVGLEIGYMVNTLIATYKLDPALVHCIGHSLGSHVCGYSGEQVQGMGRITGLDPAGPYFTGTPDFIHLDDKDAVFVDNIHTDADSIMLLGYGTAQPMGNVDIYPNSGHDQPGCDPVSIGIEFITQDMVDAGRDFIACSHMRAFKYFTEATQNPTSCKWVAHECYDYASFEMGNCYTCSNDNTRCTYLGPSGDIYTAKSRVNTMMYLDTKDSSEFCMYHYEVSILTAAPKEAESWVIGKLFIYLYDDLGEVIDHVQITRDHEKIASGEVTKSLFISQKDVGHIMHVDLKWVYNDDALNPGTYCWGLVCNRSLYVQSVHVSPISHYPESERQSYDVTACSHKPSSYTEIKDGHTQSFWVSSLCTPVST